MQDLWRLSAADLAALVKSKKVSAKEAATSALARDIAAVVATLCKIFPFGDVLECLLA